MTEGWLPAEHGTDNRDLRRRVARGLIWTLADSWGRQLLGLAIFVVLANLLFQVDIGLVALAAVFVNFAQIFVDQGLGDALVQRRVLQRAHLDTAFWISLGMGGALAVGGILLAIPLAALLDEPALEPILQVLSLSFVLYALSSVQTAILRRELNFRSLAIRSLLATIGGGIVGIGMAYLGYGPWALVGQQLTQAGLAVVTLWAVSPWRPGLHFSPPHFGELFRFSRNVVASDIVTFFSRNTDNFLVGAVLGTFQLGIYAVGFRILEATGALLIGVSRRIAFPALSRLQHDPERLKRAFFRLTRLSGLVIIPGYIGLALVAEELVIVLFGQRWAESGPIAAILFLLGPVLALNSFGNALLNASGHPGVVFRFRLITTVANVIGFFVAVFAFGTLTAVAVAFTLRGYLLLPLSIYWQRRYAGIPMLEYARQMSGITLATGVMVVAVLAVKLVIGDDVGSAALLLGEVIAGIVAFALALLVVDRRVVREAFEVGGQALPRLTRGQRISAVEEQPELGTDEDADSGPGDEREPG